MAGHSHAKNVMFKKTKANAQRSKLFSKLAREITVASKMGMPDPDHNPRLRAAMIAARTADAGAPIKGRAPHLQDLEQQISQQLKTKVQLRPGRKKGSGSITIHFYSLDQFDALLARLGVEAQ